MVNAILLVAGRVAKNTTISITLTGKAAAVVGSIWGVGGFLGGCYITHEVIEYKKYMATQNNGGRSTEYQSGMAAVESHEAVKDDVSIKRADDRYGLSYEEGSL